MPNGWPTPTAENNLKAIEALLRQTFDTPEPPDLPNSMNPQRIETQAAIDACRLHPPSSANPPTYTRIQQEFDVQQALIDANAAAGFGSSPPADTWAPVINELEHGGGGGSGSAPSISDLTALVMSLFASHAKDLADPDLARKAIRAWILRHWPGYPMAPLPTPERIKAIKEKIARRDRGGA